jgi:uncharacterized membrane protein YedE/YeeE
VKAHFAAFGAGSLFGVGLAISGMTKPSKVTGFLDVAGRWDPSLGLVMAGAVVVTFIAYRLIGRRASPIFDAKFHLPTRKDVDRRLILGATLFGVGWGLGGFCPGPGLVAGAAGVTAAIVFVAGMTIGILLEHAVARGIAHGARHRSIMADADRDGRKHTVNRRSEGNARGDADLHHLDKSFEQP